MILSGPSSLLEEYENPKDRTRKDRNNHIR
jgi:hypothetical protein